MRLETDHLRLRPPIASRHCVGALLADTSMVEVAQWRRGRTGVTLIIKPRKLQVMPSPKRVSATR
jgi:hypothetical protein